MDSFFARLPLVLIQFIPFLIAIVFHEVAHAWMASRHGDLTARNMGRETLNPLPHIDPFWTILMPLIGMTMGGPIFGAAKPVPVNYGRLKPYRRGLFLVAIAGIAMNLLLSFLSAGIWVLLRLSPAFFFTEPFTIMAEASIVINLWLAFFNLLPIPPLDGSKIIESFLNYNQLQRFERVQQYGFWILLFLLMSGALGVLRGPVMFLTNTFIGLWVWGLHALGMGIAL